MSRQTRLHYMQCIIMHKTVLDFDHIELHLHFQVIFYKHSCDFINHTLQCKPGMKLMILVTWSYLSLVLRKPAFLYMRKQRRTSAVRFCTADQYLCFHYINSTTPLLPKSEISSFWPSNLLWLYSLVCARPGRKLPMTGFLPTRLIYNKLNVYLSFSNLPWCLSKHLHYLCIVCVTQDWFTTQSVV